MTLKTELDTERLRNLQLTNDKLANQQLESASGDYAHRVFRFYDQVNPSSVGRATLHITEWVRQSDEPIEIIFHSPGGDVFSGNGLYDLLLQVRESGVHVTTVAIGLAASMSAVLLQAGDHRVMTPHSWFMIHEVGAGKFYGTTSEYKDQADLFERIERQGYEILASRSTLTATELTNRCKRKEWWLDAYEALEFGFIDEIAPTPEPRRRRRRKS